MSELIGHAIERDGSDTSLAEICLKLFDGRYINAGDKEIALWSFNGYWRSDGWSRMISDIRTFIPVLQVEISRVREELAALGEGVDPKEKSQRAGAGETPQSDPESTQSSGEPDPEGADSQGAVHVYQ